jgi:hypothetical protein
MGGVDAKLLDLPGDIGSSDRREALQEVHDAPPVGPPCDECPWWIAFRRRKIR